MSLEVYNAQTYNFLNTKLSSVSFSDHTKAFKNVFKEMYKTLSDFGDESKNSIVIGNRYFEDKNSPACYTYLNFYIGLLENLSQQLTKMLEFETKMFQNIGSLTSK